MQQIFAINHSANPGVRANAKAGVLTPSREVRRPVRRDLLHPPRRAFGPVPHHIAGPSGGFIDMARGARIGDLAFFRHRRGDECESVRPHVDVGDSHFNLRHVASHARAAGRAIFVMRMFGQSRGPRAIP